MGLFTDNYGDLSLGRLLSIIGIAGVLGIGGCNIMNKWQVSEGDKVGVINKVSHKGAFNFTTTWESQMAAEGLVSDGTSSGANLFDFAVDNYWAPEKQNELVKQLKDVMDSGQKVKIHYTKMMGTFPWRSGSDYLIQYITPIEGTRSRSEGRSSVESTVYSAPQVGRGKLEVSLDGRDYILKHDTSGKLKVTELREVQ